MNKKIVGIFVCMLMVLTAFSAVATTTKQEKSSLVLSSVTPNDPGFSKQYYLQTTHRLMFVRINLFGKIPFLFPIPVKPDTDIDAPEAWGIETGSSDVVIAFVNSGIDYTHPDLKANIWNNTDEIPNNDIDDDDNGYIDDVMGWNFVQNNSDPKDEYYYGTVCAGIAGAVSNNGIGVAGICWNCSLMPLKVMNETGVSYWEDITKAIRYAADNGAKVICIAPGDYTAPTFVLDAVNYAYNKGVFLCAEVALNNKADKFYPAAYENVTAVAGINSVNKALYMTNYGDWVDICAPGSIGYTTTPTYPVYMSRAGLTQEYSFSGSYPAIVAGVAALLLSKNSSLTPDEVKALLCNNTDPYSGNKDIGSGRVNAYKALTALVNESLIR